jgi:hypothetical protein
VRALALFATEGYVADLNGRRAGGHLRGPTSHTVLMIYLNPRRAIGM